MDISKRKTYTVVLWLLILTPAVLQSVGFLFETKWASGPSCPEVGITEICCTGLENSTRIIGVYLGNTSVNCEINPYREGIVFYFLFRVT